MFKEIKGKNPIKKQLKYVALGGVAGHQMAAALFPVHRGGCTYLLWFLVRTSFPSPPLPFLYAVMQADVGLFCCVLLSLSPLPPDLHSNIKKRGKNKIKKNFICSTWITKKASK